MPNLAFKFIPFPLQGRLKFLELRLYLHNRLLLLIQYLLNHSFIVLHLRILLSQHLDFILQHLNFLLIATMFLVFGFLISRHHLILSSDIVKVDFEELHLILRIDTLFVRSLDFVKIALNRSLKMLLVRDQVGFILFEFLNEDVSLV